LPRGHMKVNIHLAKTVLSRLFEKVALGEEAPIAKRSHPRKLGSAKGDS
jgi:antitoxin (DNA-binding transcriptional repressor) of toxin-antitoxin stability system